MVRTPIQLMRTLDKMLEKCTIVMKLLYYDDVKPMDYEPPFLKGCTEVVHNPCTINLLKMEIGNVNSKHFVLALKVKSVCDPCEDKNDNIQNDDINLGPDSVERDDDIESDNNISKYNQYIVAPIDEQRVQKDGVTIARNINFKENVKNVGADLMKQVAKVIISTAGDSTICAIVLTQAIFAKDVECDALSEEHGLRLDKVQINTIILHGGGVRGDEKQIKERCEQLRAAIEKSAAMLVKEKAQEWLSRLSGGVAVFKVGGVSEAEVGERKDRVIDALNATRVLKNLQTVNDGQKFLGTV